MIQRRNRSPTPSPSPSLRSNRSSDNAVVVEAGGTAAVADETRQQQKQQPGNHHNHQKQQHLHPSSPKSGSRISMLMKVVVIISSLLLLLLAALYYYGHNNVIAGGSNDDDDDESLSDDKNFFFQPDVIIVGSGLAGLTTAITVLDRGGSVVIIEKEKTLGGNSNKASSGINSCCDNDSDSVKDNLDLFVSDTTKSAGNSANPKLISTLVNSSLTALQFLKNRVHVDLSQLAQLGGHSVARTHRPLQGMVGAEIIYGLTQILQNSEKFNDEKTRLQIWTETKVTKLLTTKDENDADVIVNGVEYESLSTNSDKQGVVYAPSGGVVLATGGFASYRAEGSLLNQYRPELKHFPTTAGSFSTGDGIRMVLDDDTSDNNNINAATVDMEYIQLHPTGFVDPTDANNPTKTLAAEVLRGVGGILLNDTGHRFCNELGLRSYVTDQMLRHNKYYRQHGKWSKEQEDVIPTFAIVLSSKAAKHAQKHVDLYVQKGLLTKLEDGGTTALARWLGVDDSTVIRQTWEKYLQAAANDGRKDEFGKTTFPNLPKNDKLQNDNEVFYVGHVTPVLHYCMGGLSIDEYGRVLLKKKNRDNNDNNVFIPGLYAVGEVSGGVHGVNRLGGNSLLECTVFGTIVGNQIPISTSRNNDSSGSTTTKKKASKDAEKKKRKKPKALPKIAFDELKRHNTPENCWIAIHGIVYDLTDFAEEHPAGKAPIHMHAGKDATETFDIIHTGKVLERFELAQVGKLDPSSIIATTDA